MWLLNVGKFLPLRTVIWHKTQNSAHQSHFLCFSRSQASEMKDLMLIAGKWDKQMNYRGYRLGHVTRDYITNMYIHASLQS
jgi:hypothetical protein